MLSETVALSKQLIDRPSVTPNDAGCQDILIERLAKLGFSIIRLPSNGVSNFWAVHGQQGPLFAFSGHTDVVPPGSEHDWRTPPFQATIQDNIIFGRGAADMKTALAAMIVATERFIAKHPNHHGRIGFMVTSDEEGNATDGTAVIVKHLQENKTQIDWCLVGEASSQTQLGDSIKVGRRGSLHGALTVFGKQGHIAYPNQAINPIHRSFQALDFLTHIEWDQGNDHFSPTSFQIYNINADTGASNVIPGSLTARFNFRYAPCSTAESLIQRTHEAFDSYRLQYTIDWNHASQPFMSTPGRLTDACIGTIKTHCHLLTQPNTTGGTSDGRFIAPTGAEVIELGLCSGSIHQVNENTNIDDLEKLTILYEAILERLLA